MSLLNRLCSVPVTVYPQVTTIDADGNTLTVPSTVGIPTMARVQKNQRTLGRMEQERARTSGRGYETEATYTLRFTPEFVAEYGSIGAQAAIEWQPPGVSQPEVWRTFGNPDFRNSSSRTARLIYQIQRS